MSNNLRFENKYFVPFALLPRLRQAILPYMELDVHVEHKESFQYSVRSIYFDSGGFDYYHDKVQGIGNRDKVRIRAYHENTDESIAFLEIKRKYSVPLTKYRVPFKAIDILNLFGSRESEDYILGNGREYPDTQENYKRFFYYIYKNNLKPMILVVFEREPYNCKFDKSVRITFDKNLRSYPYPTLEEIFKERGLIESFEGHFIMEVKFSHTFPFWMRPIISKFNLKTEAISKYVTSVDTHRMLTDNSRYYAVAQAHFF